MTTKQKISTFLASQQLMVVSTAWPDTGKPEAALVAFAYDEALNIYFQTGKHTRKAQNLRRNPQVALVFGLQAEDMMTVQYEGQAQQLISAAEIAACKQLFRTRNSPTTEEHLNHPSTILFKVKPKWVGYSDYSHRPTVVEEARFPSI